MNMSWGYIDFVMMSVCQSILLSVNVSMPPTLKKLRGHIGLGLSVRPSVHNTLAAEKLKIHICQNLEIIYMACT